MGSQAATEQIARISVCRIEDKPTIKSTLFADISVSRKSIECVWFVCECGKSQ